MPFIQQDFKNMTSSVTKKGHCYYTCPKAPVQPLQPERPGPTLHVKPDCLPWCQRSLTCCFLMLPPKGSLVYKEKGPST